MSRDDWQETSCSSCGSTIHYHVDWNRVPDLCKDCIAEKRAERAKWHETSCSSCGTTISYHDDWDRIPDLCKSCIAVKKAERAKWHETRCTDCGTTIKYHEDWNRIPDLCKSCRDERRRKWEEAKAQWKETSCADCGTTIKYHVDWDRVPDLCKNCIDKRKAERAKWHETRCKDCSSTIKYHQDWDRIPDLCQSCIAKRKAERAKWHEKSCALCHATIKYHQDWINVPDYCKSCNEWQTKTCAAQGCSDVIRYKKYWDRVPEYCKPCKSGEREVTQRRQRADGGYDEYTGRGYVNRNGVIVFTDDSYEGKHSHTVIKSDGTQKGHREKGHGQQWETDEWKETQCSECGKLISYHVNWDRIPDLCKPCIEKKKEERKQRSKHTRSYQRPIPFDEHRAGQAEISENGTRVDIFEGWSPSAVVTEELGRWDKHVQYNDHSHKVYIDGRLVYHRDENGNVLVNRRK